MKKKVLLLLLIVLIVGVAGCAKKEEQKPEKAKNEAALAVKKEYEDLNGKANASGKLHRVVTIPEDNPYVKVTPAEIVKMVEEKKSFFLYVGDPLCPWCRSVIESSIASAKANYIDKIYYIDIWDDDHNEILRDVYELNDKNKPVKKSDGTEEYTKLLEAFKDVLRDYELETDKGKKVKVGEKRIYAPNFFLIDKGEAKMMISGKSDLLTDSRMELTDEIKAAQKVEFDKLFSTACDTDCCGHSDCHIC